MTDQTVYAVFSSSDEAEQAVSKLRCAQVPEGSICIVSRSNVSDSDPDFAHTLEECGVADDEFGFYQERLDGGGVFVAVNAEDADADPSLVSAILYEHRGE